MSFKMYSLNLISTYKTILTVLSHKMIYSLHCKVVYESGVGWEKGAKKIKKVFSSCL